MFADRAKIYIRSGKGGDAEALPEVKYISSGKERASISEENRV